MKLRGAISVTLALLLAAGSLAFATSGAGTGAAKSPKASKAPASKAARGKRSSKHSRRRERGQKAPTPERITEIQQALAKDGSFTAKPNGKWDVSTIEAMRKFQTVHGLNPTGKLDALTLQKLGLGSTTAGIAAPSPPISSTSLSPSPAPAQSTPQL